MIEIEVIYAPHAEEQALYRLSVPERTTVAEGLRLSGVFEAFPELNSRDLSVGIYAQLASMDTVLRSGDRLEIYRPLAIDPKEARRLRAQKRGRK